MSRRKVNERHCIPTRIKKKVIKKSGLKCFYCQIEGFLNPDHPTKVFLKNPTKKWINIYDQAFYFQHIAMHFDHVIPVSKGGKNTVRNLVLCCPACNIKKSNKEGPYGRWKNAKKGDIE